LSGCRVTGTFKLNSAEKTNSSPKLESSLNKRVIWAPAASYHGAPCWSDSFTVGLAIAEGHYAPSNVTAAKFLNLVDPGATYNCPLYLGYGNPAGYIFQPLSDTAMEYGCNGTSPCLAASASTEVAVAGYWNQGGSFTNFQRGTYTVVAEDQWGNLVLVYFTVS